MHQVSNQVLLTDVLAPSASTEFKAKHMQDNKKDQRLTALISSISKNIKVRTKTKKLR